MSILSEPVSWTVYKGQDAFFLGDGVTVYSRRRADMVVESLSRKGYSPIVETEFPGRLAVVE